MGQIQPFRSGQQAAVEPVIAPDAFIAPGAVVIGDVDIGPQASIWYGSVLRGDVGRIVVGARSNIQDLCCVHMTTDESDSIIGQDVTIGHSVVIHGARIDEGALIGMGALLMDNAHVGAEALVAAGTLIPVNMVVPPGTLVKGRPGKVVRELSRAERAQGRAGAARYVQLARDHAR